MSEADVSALQAKATSASQHETGSFGIGQGSLDLKVFLAWAAVGIPILWGVWNTLLSIRSLF